MCLLVRFSFPSSWLGPEIYVHTSLGPNRQPIYMLSMNRSFLSDWGQLIARTSEYIEIEFSIRIHMPSSAAKTIKYRLRGHLKTPNFPTILMHLLNKRKSRKGS